MKAANLEKLRQKLEADGYRLIPVNAPVEYGRFHDLERNFGIPRSTAYLLINEGKIDSHCVKLARSRTGLRLIDMNSVRRFLEGCPKQPTEEISNEKRRAVTSRKWRAVTSRKGATASK
jgi:hypothetical protein